MARNTPHIPKGSLVGSPGFPRAGQRHRPKARAPAAHKRQFGSTVAHGQTIEKPPPYQAGICDGSLLVARPGDDWVRLGGVCGNVDPALVLVACYLRGNEAGGDRAAGSGRVVRRDRVVDVAGDDDFTGSPKWPGRLGQPRAARSSGSRWNSAASQNQLAAESARACALANQVLKIRNGVRTARP
jgi:hypothetical protein